MEQEISINITLTQGQVADAIAQYLYNRLDSLGIDPQKYQFWAANGGISATTAIEADAVIVVYRNN